MATEAHTATGEESEGQPDPIQSLAHILSVLHVKRVYYIDDVFVDPSLEVSRVIGQITEVRNRDQQAAQELIPEVDLTLDEFWEDAVREWWPSLRSAERYRIQAALGVLLGDEKEAFDYGAPVAITSLFPDFIQFEPIHPDDWDTRKTELTTSNDNSRILCLFDVNLGDVGGAERARNGIDLLVEALTLDSEKEVIFGLFSTTFTAGQEIPDWRDLARDHVELANAKGRFLPLAKSRQDNPLEFARGFEMMALNLFCDRLKSEVCGAVETAARTAQTSLQNLEVFDFEAVVLNGSYREGVWEADTLLRLFHLFFRDEAKRQMLAGDRTDSFNQDVRQARAIRENGIAGWDHPPHRRWDIRHQELIEDSKLLNAFHSPLRLGDVFLRKAEAASHWYVLLAQPCDLMVRPDGRRAATSVMLVPIRIMSQSEFQERRQNPDWAATRFPVRYFLTATHEEGGQPNAWKVGVLEFARYQLIDPAVLDLCVLHPDGRCEIDWEEDINTPPQLNGAWRERVGKLIGDFQQHHGRIVRMREAADQLPGTVQNDVRRMIRRAIVPSFSSGVKLNSDYVTASGLDFGIQRVMHIRSPESDHLLDQFTRFLARRPVPFDFGSDRLARPIGM